MIRGSISSECRQAAGGSFVRTRSPHPIPPFPPHPRALGHQVWENTDKRILKEIIVVDDGSRPPLRKIMSACLRHAFCGLRVHVSLGFRFT